MAENTAGEDLADGDESDGDNTGAVLVSTEPKYGCMHYERKCAFVSPCCAKIHVCRLCHDDKEMHSIDRHAVAEIVCLICDTRQPVAKCCVNCGVEFGRYFCSVCRMYDDRDRDQFHCELCGMCRIGGRENYFHCAKCDMCLAIGIKDSHKCVEKVTHSNCPVCLEDLHSSTEHLAVLTCGHITHRKCFHGLLTSGNYACPLCCQSTVDLSSYWKQLDEDIAATPMPDEYKDKNVWVLCRDCHKKCNTAFHVIGLKCSHCGSYNTCMESEPTELPPSDCDKS